MNDSVDYLHWNSDQEPARRKRKKRETKAFSTSTPQNKNFKLETEMLRKTIIARHTIAKRNKGSQNSVRGF